MNKLVNWYKRTSKTMQFQLTTRFTGIMLAVIILLSFLTLSATALRLYESTKQETESIQDAFSQVETQTNQEWKDNLRLYIAADDPRYFIRVALSDGSSVYSSNAYHLYNNFYQMKQLFFLPDILWDDDDPYYLLQFNVEGTNVAVLTSMEDNFDILITLFKWVSIISMLILLLGTIFIYRFSKKLSSPLVQMNQEIQSFSADLTAQKALTEPEEPQEAHHIAKSFNHLLHEQKQTLQREQQFITDASHELKTPLAAIRGHINLIRRRGTAHPEVIPKSLAFIDKESKRMETLTQQLLVLDRERQITNQQETIFIEELINTILEEFQPELTQELKLFLDDKIKIYGQKEHFYQIFKNLIENAIKYSPADGKIGIQTKEENENIIFSISNTGKSIPDKEKEKIFERFYRVDASRSSDIPGSGIGLAIVKQLTELYHGTIKVADSETKGVCFTLIFPQKATD